MIGKSQGKLPDSSVGSRREVYKFPVLQDFQYLGGRLVVSIGLFFWDVNPMSSSAIPNLKIQLIQGAL